MMAVTKQVRGRGKKRRREEEKAISTSPDSVARAAHHCQQKYGDARGKKNVVSVPEDTAKGLQENDESNKSSHAPLQK